MKRLEGLRREQLTKPDELYQIQTSPITHHHPASETGRTRWRCTSNCSLPRLVFSMSGDVHVRRLDVPRVRPVSNGFCLSAWKREKRMHLQLPVRRRRADGPPGAVGEGRRAKRLLRPRGPMSSYQRFPRMEMGQVSIERRSWVNPNQAGRYLSIRRSEGHPEHRQAPRRVRMDV